MTESREDQDIRHKALDRQWKFSACMRSDALEFKNCVRVLRTIDPKAENNLRAVEEIIRDIRARHPRKGKS